MYRLIHNFFLSRNTLNVYFKFINLFTSNINADFAGSFDDSYK